VRELLGMSLAKKSCVCYVVDDNYLFPTLVSAAQVRQHSERNKADVIIICLAEPSEKTKIASEVAGSLGILLWVKSLSEIDNMHPMYGRLFLNRLLPKEYERTVYIDGDTQVVGSLTPLIDAPVPDGKFLAVRDPASLFARISSEWKRATCSDRKAAGLSGNLDDYFNTGLLVFDLSSWEILSAKTKEAISAKEGGYKFGDQDPMNVAIGRQCLFLSNTWNFPGFLINTQAENRTRPIVYHFMSNPRPWTHSGMPWGRKWSKPYRDFLNRFPQLQTLAPRASVGEILKYRLQQQIKWRTEYSRVGNLMEASPDVKVNQGHRTQI